MWERFEQFADDFVLRAQRRAADANALRRDDGSAAEVWVSKLCVGFARDTGPTATGSTLTLLRSAFVPGGAAPATWEPPATPAGLPQVLQDLARSLDPDPCACWRLTFKPGTGEMDEWHFSHAEVQGPDGHWALAGNIGWIAELLPLQRPDKPTALFAAELDVQAAPAAKGNGYAAAHEVLVRKLQKEAKEGLAHAQLLMGVNSAAGVGLPKDDASAVAWFELAAARGHLAALLLLGWMAATGRGTPRDSQRARALWQRAAAQGLARAHAVLGMLVQAGEVIGRDLELARTCLSLAATAGLPQAHYHLGRIAECGMGCRADNAEAWHAYRCAAMLGLQDAFTRLQILPAQPPRDAWPGEHRARTAAWLRGRRSRASEREGAETALALAELWDEALAVGTVSSAQVQALVLAASHRDALAWGTASEVLRGLQRAGVDVSAVQAQLAGHRSAKVRERMGL